MSQDIRNFFAAAQPSKKRKRDVEDSEEVENLSVPVAKKPEKKAKAEVVVEKPLKKRKRAVIDSDNEESEPTPVEKKPEKKTKVESQKRPKRVQVDSDDDIKVEAVVKAKKPTQIIKYTGPPLSRLNLTAPKEQLMQWVDKYKPANISQVIGQHTEKSCAKSLLKWLKNWPKNNLGPAGAVKKAKPSPFQQGDGSAFKAALLSGPPGIGKTTSAVLACKELGLKYVELNASDARSKKQMEKIVEEMLHSRLIGDFFGQKSTPIVAQGGYKVNHVLIMDEVDGMSGNQDRAGIAELIQLIKQSEIPIICVCNDRQSQKIRSLAGHCFDLRFHRPTKEQIIARLLSIAGKEKFKLDKAMAEKVALAANLDMRQAIYSLQLQAAGLDSKNSVIETKNTELNIFEAAHQIFSKSSDLRKKRELFFTDYSIMPLFVQENYLGLRSTELNKKEQLQQMAKASECIALGDMMSKSIRSSQNWSLLPSYGSVSSALPPLYMGAGKGPDFDGFLVQKLDFPSWLGKNSTYGKRVRMIHELEDHVGLKIRANLQTMSTDYIPSLRSKLLLPLSKDQQEAIPDVLETFNAYDLVKDDLDLMNEMYKDKKPDVWDKVETKTKAALTRALNKQPQKHAYVMAKDVVVPAREKVGKRKAAQKAEEKLGKVLAEDENEEEDEEANGEQSEQTHAELLDAF